MKEDRSERQGFKVSSPARRTSQPLSEITGRESQGHRATYASPLYCFLPRRKKKQNKNTSHLASNVCEVPFMPPSFGPCSSRSGLNGTLCSQKIQPTSSFHLDFDMGMKAKPGQFICMGCQSVPGPMWRYYLVISLWVPGHLFHPLGAFSCMVIYKNIKL